MEVEINYVEPTEIGLVNKNWNVIELSEVCTAIIDCLHSKKPTFVDNEEYIYLEVSNIGNNGFLKRNKFSYVTSDIYEEWTKRLKPKARDIVITKTGRVGATAILPEGLNICIGRNQVIIRPNEESIIPEFLLLYFQSNVFQRELSRLTIDGTILKSLHVKYISKIKIPLPSKQDQKYISSLIFGIMKKIELNQQSKTSNYSCFPPQIPIGTNISSVQTLPCCPINLSLCPSSLTTSGTSTR